MATKYERREDALYEGERIVPKVGDIVDVVDEKLDAWMVHPVIVFKIKDGVIYGFECTSSSDKNTSKGYLNLLDWEEEGFDSYCKYHTVKCDRMEAYDIENIRSRRGVVSEQDKERIVQEHNRFCKYEGRGQTEADLDSLENKKRAEFNSLLKKAKPVIPRKK